VPVRYSFGDFVLDVAERSLTRRSSPASEDQSTAQPMRVHLQPKTFDLLVHFVTHAGKLHTKRSLLDEVWSDVVVTENSLTRSIHLLRTALNDTAEGSRFVQTVPRVGYRFIEAITPEETSTLPGLSPTPQLLSAQRCNGGSECGSAVATKDKHFVRAAALWIGLAVVLLATLLMTSLWQREQVHAPLKVVADTSVAILPFVVRASTETGDVRRINPNANTPAPSSEGVPGSTLSSPVCAVVSSTDGECMCCYPVPSIA
jgi:DNA-binding winged helix-turn-helix (wHTH) protein